MSCRISCESFCSLYLVVFSIVSFELLTFYWLSGICWQTAPGNNLNNWIWDHSRRLFVLLLSSFCLSLTLTLAILPYFKKFFCFLSADIFRTSVRSKPMWGRPEPGFVSRWRRNCFPDTWSSCSLIKSLQSEQKIASSEQMFTLVLLWHSQWDRTLTSSHVLFSSWPSFLLVQECLSQSRWRWWVIWTFIIHYPFLILHSIMQ